jgi:hypothetical protein
MTTTTDLSTPTIVTYGATLQLDNHPHYREVNFHFRPYLDAGVEPDWRHSEMTIELINKTTSMPEIHVFRPLKLWTDDQMRDWVRMKQNVFPHRFSIDEVFAKAVLDLVM